MKSIAPEKRTITARVLVSGRTVYNELVQKDDTVEVDPTTFANLSRDGVLTLAEPPAKEPAKPKGRGKTPEAE